MSNPILKEFALKKPVKKLKAKNPIRRRTSKRAADEARYRRTVKVWLEHKICRASGCYRFAEEVHHKFGRAGKLLLWKQGWIPLCSHHHRWVHSYPETARRMGLLCEVGQWNNQGLVKE